MISCSVLGQDIIFPDWKKNPTSTILHDSLKKEKVVILNEFEFSKLFGETDSKNNIFSLSTYYLKIKIIDTTNIKNYDFFDRLISLDDNIKIKARIIKPNNDTLSFLYDSIFFKNVTPNTELEILVRGKNNLENLFGYQFLYTEFKTLNYTKVYQVSNNLRLRFSLYNNCPVPLQTKADDYVNYIWTNKDLKKSNPSSISYNPFFHEPYFLFDDRIGYTWEDAINDFYFIEDITTAKSIKYGNLVFDFISDYYNENKSKIENINQVVNYVRNNFEIIPYEPGIKINISEQLKAKKLHQQALYRLYIKFFQANGIQFKICAGYEFSYSTIDPTTPTSQSIEEFFFIIFDEEMNPHYFYPQNNSFYFVDDIPYFLEGTTCIGFQYNDFSKYEFYAIPKSKYKDNKYTLDMSVNIKNNSEKAFISVKEKLSGNNRQNILEHIKIDHNNSVNKFLITHIDSFLVINDSSINSINGDLNLMYDYKKDIIKKPNSNYSLSINKILNDYWMSEILDIEDHIKTPFYIEYENTNQTRIVVNFEKAIKYLNPLEINYKHASAALTINATQINERQVSIIYRYLETQKMTPLKDAEDIMIMKSLLEEFNNLDINYIEK